MIEGTRLHIWKAIFISFPTLYDFIPSMRLILWSYLFSWVVETAMKHNCTFLIKVAKTLARVQREIADVPPFAETVEWQSPRNLSNRSIYITWLFSEMSFRMHFGSISDTFPNFIRNASQMHQKCIINLSQIQIKTQYFFKISLPYTLKLIKYQVSIVKSKFMEINLSKTLQNCCKWLH